MFVRHSGQHNIRSYKKKASTAFAKGDLVIADANGFVDKAVTASAKETILGIIQRDVVAADADYALNSEVEIDVPVRLTDWFIADVSTGTPAQTDVGEIVEIDDENSIDVVATTAPLVRVERLYTASPAKVIVSFL